MGIGEGVVAMRWVLLSIITIAALVIVVALGPSLTPFDVNNTYWDGYSTAASICLKPVYVLNGPINASAVFVVPEVEIPRAQVDLLLRYVEGGGRLVVINGGPPSNELLRELGLNSRFSGAVIEDPVLNYINDKFPLAFIVSNPLLPINASVIVLDNATPIIIRDPGSIVLTETSPFSRAGNESGPFPVVVAVPLGRGYVILVSTPSIFMNSLINEAGNSELLRALCNGTAIYLENALAVNNAQLLIRSYLYSAYFAMLTYPLNYLLITLPLIATSIVLLIRGRG